MHDRVRVALMDANMRPDQIRVIEASGLGEPYGDAVEVGAYKAIFQPGRDKCNPLIFNSVHTNFGHLDGASGVSEHHEMLFPIVSWLQSHHCNPIHACF
jgi:acyl transferase domain-containing protein